MPRANFKRKYARNSGKLYKRRRVMSPSYRRRRIGAGYTGKAKMYKQIALKLAESKENFKNLVFTGGTGNAFYHDTLYRCNLHSKTDDSGVFRIAAGTSIVNRVGQKVFSTGIRVRGLFSVPWDRRNTKVKMWLVEYNSAQGSVTTYNDFFRNATGNGMLDTVNNEKFKRVKLLRQLRLTGRDLNHDNAAGALGTLYYDIWIPFKRTLTWDTSSESAPCGGVSEYLTLVILPYDAPATQTLDILLTSGHEQCVTWYFKDP